MIDYNKIPESTLETLKAYIQTGRPMGSFCEAVVENNLREACTRADEQNRQALFEIVAWLYNYAPGGSWGYPGAIKSWTAHLKAQQAERAL